MVGWISITLFVGFIALFIKILWDSILDIGATLTVVSLIALISFILAGIYLDSTLVLVLSIALLVSVFIKQRLL